MNKQENDNHTIIEDLPVTDEQAKQTKAGGYDSLGRLYSVTDASKY